MKNKKAILLVNLGSPSEPTAPSIAAYLGEFLSDKRVVDLPALLWQPILRGIILRTRPAKLVPKYQAIWRKDGAPLKAITAQQARLLGERLAAQGVPVYWCMRYQEPSIQDTLQKIRADGCTDVLVLPMYPQFSHTTTSTVTDEVERFKNTLNIQTIEQYHEHAMYIDALKQSVLQHWATVGKPNFSAGERLLLSFHGLPMRNIERGDPYQAQCVRTYELLVQSLGLTQGEVDIAYQSRFGAQKWLQPSTQATLEKYAAQNCTRVDVICPGFSADCLETLEEIAQELKHIYLTQGGQNYHYIACLNTQKSHIGMLHQLVSRYVRG